MEAQIANLSREALQNAGMTAKIAMEWVKFYRNEAIRVGTIP